MTHYETLVQSLKEHVLSYDRFMSQGRQAIAKLLQGFAEFLVAPAGTCRVGPPGVAFDSNTTAPIDQIAELQEDGWFAGCLVVNEQSPHGVMVRFTFLARIDGDSTVVKMDHDKNEFRLKDFQLDSLKPFFEHVCTTAIDQFRTSPEKLVTGTSKRAIGFTYT